MTDAIAWGGKEGKGPCIDLPREKNQKGGKRNHECMFTKGGGGGAYAEIITIESSVCRKGGGEREEEERNCINVGEKEGGGGSRCDSLVRSLKNKGKRRKHRFL